MRFKDYVNESIKLDSYPSKVNTVTKALKELGLGDYELVRGNGYFWFDGPDTSSFYSSSVDVFSLQDMTIKSWINELLKMIEKHYGPSSMTSDSKKIELVNKIRKRL